MAEDFPEWNWSLTELATYIKLLTEVEFVHAVTAGGSVKFLPAV